MIRKSSEIRQKEIKSAVLTIIHRDGLKKVSTKNIANEIGLSEGSIFRHFDSKKDIILSIMDDVIMDLVGNLKKISLETTSPEKRLFKYLCQTISYLIEHKGITILLFSEASYENDEDLILKLNYIFKNQKLYVGNIVLDGMNNGQWDKTIAIKDFVSLYMGIPITLNIEMVLNRESFQSDNFCKRMYNLILKILTKG